MKRFLERSLRARWWFLFFSKAALKDSYECILVIENTNLQDVLSAEGRLKQAVDDYLTHEKLADKIKLKFGCVTYPDEASNRDDLIKMAFKK